MDDTRFALKKAQETIRSLEEELSETNRGLMALTTELEEANERLKEEIEERKRVEETVRAERQRLYEVLETLPVYVCLLDADYYMPFANRYFRETFGGPHGHRCHEFLFNRKEPCEICETYTVLKTGAPHHWYWTGPNERDYDIYDFPFIDADGSMLILEMGIDVTERKLAEDALRESESKYKALYEFSADGIFLTDYNGTIVDANEAALKMYGYSSEEIRGTRVVDLVHPEDLKAIPFKLQEIIDRTIHFMTRRMRKKDGTYLTVEATAATVTDNLIQVIYRDITEREHMRDLLESRALELAIANEDLRRSNRDLQQFGYVASHDLQEPLRNIASCLQLLEKKYKNKLDADADQLIHYAVESSVRMKALILDLLAYSRVATRGKPPSRIDFEQILDHTVKNLRSAISEAGAVITHDPLPTIFGDDSQLLQVFQNLIQNAIKFRKDEPPKIHVSGVKNTNEWVFAVKDNGIGIASRHLDRIFVIFRRLHKRSQYDGTGMGLAIVKKVVERHGGRIWVESEPGVGSTFYFTIPEKGMVQT